MTAQNEHFILTFGKDGDPNLERVRYDSKTGDYHHMPIPRDSQLSMEALASPAGVAYKILKDRIPNIKLEYRIRVLFAPGLDTVLYSKDGCEVFMDEHGQQWIKFVADNGPAAGREHMIRANEVVIVRDDAR